MKLAKWRTPTVPPKRPIGHEGRMLELTYYTKLFISLLVIVDPLGAIPLFATFTAQYSPSDRRKTARTASIAMAAVLIVNVFCGELILKAFGISISSFKIGGGLLLLLMAVEMMQARPIPSKHTPEEDRENEDKAAIGIVPLGIPLLAGPGTISTVIIYSHKSSHLGHMAALVLICILTALVTWLALLSAHPIGKLLGRTGINIAIRLMGLILSALAVEFIVGGLVDFFPGLAH